MADSRDFMLNEEDDFKPQSSGFEEVDGADIFADVSNKQEESKAFDDIDGSDIFGDGDKEERAEEAAQEEVVAEKEEVLKLNQIFYNDI